MMIPMIQPFEPVDVVSALSQVCDWGQTHTGVRAWRERQALDGSGVTVAVLDTGVADHPDLPSVRRLDVRGGDGIDRNGHGTHVCGIIGACDNGIGVIGVAPGVTMISIKVLDDGGCGNHRLVADGIGMAVSEGAQVINMSLGSPTQPPDALVAAIGDAVAAGAHVAVAASGNSRSEVPEFPARLPGVISVGAIDDRDVLAPFTSKGARIYAPGVQVHSTYLDGGYVLMDGTSQACPFVAGFVALLVQKHGCQGVDASLAACTDSDGRLHVE